MVFDLGGGTLDVSILDISADIIQVVSTAGDNHLGGDDWDRVFCNYLCERFEKENPGVKLDDGTDNAAMTKARILEAARAAKEDLSTSSSTTVNLPFITVGPAGPLHMNYKITREEFENITKELFDRCKKPISDAMAGSPENPIDLSFSEIDSVLLVGGSTRMPYVRTLVKDVTGKDPEQTVNPDEVVAAGAAIQGSIVKGDSKGILLLDVNSMTLGIKLADGSVNAMIPRNTQIPAEATDTYTTSADNQTNVEIVVVQGENLKDYKDPANKILGSYSMDGIPPQPRGVPVIEIKLSYDVNGIVNLEAMEKTSGKTLNITIEGNTKLKDDEVKSLAAAEKKTLASSN